MNIDLILCRLLSFTSLAGGWLAARILKFYLYDVEGFHEIWIVKPVPLWSEVTFFFGTVIGSHVLILVAALVLDSFLWPVLFRDEAKELIEIQNSN